MKTILSVLSILLLATPVFATSTAIVYSSPILVLLFVGFCALIIVAQLVPAVLTLIGMTKAVSYKKTTKVKA